MGFVERASGKSTHGAGDGPAASHGDTRGRGGRTHCGGLGAAGHRGLRVSGTAHGFWPGSPGQPPHGPAGCPIAGPRTRGPRSQEGFPAQLLHGEEPWGPHQVLVGTSDGTSAEGQGRRPVPPGVPTVPGHHCQHVSIVIQLIVSTFSTNFIPLTRPWDLHLSPSHRSLEARGAGGSTPVPLLSRVSPSMPQHISSLPR